MSRRTPPSIGEAVNQPDRRNREKGDGGENSDTANSHFCPSRETEPGGVAHLLGRDPDTRPGKSPGVPSRTRDQTHQRTGHRTQHQAHTDDSEQTSR
jgi:hypothetical protein